MIRRLRWKFIAVIMTASALFLAVILGTLYGSSKANFRQRSIGLLQMSLKDSYSFSGSESDKDRDPLITFPEQSPSSDRDLIPPEKRFPVVVAEKSGDGSVRILRGQGLLMDEEKLDLLIAETEASGLDGGEFPDQGLRWLRSRADSQGAIRYAFTDTYQEQDALHWQLTFSAVIGVLSLGVFFTLSVFLSRWITRPIAQAWKTQQQFVSDASHELKTPLTVILSNISLLKQSSSISDPADRQRMEHIASETRRMKELAEGLLLLARSDYSGRKPSSPAFASVDLSYLTERCIATFEPVAFEMGKSISGEIHPGIFVRGDEGRLQQLISILLDNGCKYSKEKSSVLAGLSQNGADVMLTVCSEGTPLSPEEIRQLFHRFYRADPSRGAVPGFGLGLSIAQCICEEHGGQISASTDGVSVNTFTVRLPAEKDQAFHAPSAPT